MGGTCSKCWDERKAQPSRPSTAAEIGDPGPGPDGPALDGGPRSAGSLAPAPARGYGASPGPFAGLFTPGDASKTEDKAEENGSANSGVPGSDDESVQADSDSGWPLFRGGESASEEDEYAAATDERTSAAREYVVDAGGMEAPGPGLRYHLSPSESDLDPCADKAFVKWGRIVRGTPVAAEGADSDDEDPPTQWVRVQLAVGDRFLPMAVDGHTVLEENNVPSDIDGGEDEGDENGCGQQ